MKLLSRLKYIQGKIKLEIAFNLVHPSTDTKVHPRTERVKKCTELSTSTDTKVHQSTKRISNLN